MSASLFKFLVDRQCFLQFRFIMLTLHRSLLKITGIRWHAVLNQRVHEVQCLVKTVLKSQVTSSKGRNLSFLSSPSSGRIPLDFHGNLLWWKTSVLDLRAFFLKQFHWMNQIIISFSWGMASWYFSVYFQSINRNVGQDLITWIFEISQHTVQLRLNWAKWMYRKKYHCPHFNVMLFLAPVVLTECLVLYPPCTYLLS